MRVRMHALTIFAVHESVEGERRLRAVRTDHDNFRCRALHPRLPEKRTKMKILSKNLSAKPFDDVDRRPARRAPWLCATGR